jgi:hypothetical protein
MKLLSNPAILIILALVGVVIINLLLIASVQSQSKRTGKSTIRRMLRSIREPFNEGDRDLDELASLVEKLGTHETDDDPE